MCKIFYSSLSNYNSASSQVGLAEMESLLAVYFTTGMKDGKDADKFDSEA